MKFLVMEATKIWDTDKPFLHVNLWQYLKRRCQFWKWRKKRTMGRPVLILWREPEQPKEESHE